MTTQLHQTFAGVLEIDGHSQPITANSVRIRLTNAEASAAADRGSGPTVVTESFSAQGNTVVTSSTVQSGGTTTTTTTTSDEKGSTTTTSSTDGDGNTSTTIKINKK